MKTNRAIVVYLLGTMTQIGGVYSIIAVLRFNKVNYNNFIGLIFLAIAGLSTAICGCVVSKLTGKIKFISCVT